MNELQEACDYAVLKIVEQGGWCVDDKDICVHQSGERHCVIGWLLDHDDPFLMQTRTTIGNLCTHVPSKIPNVIKDNLDTFVYLQLFHDAGNREAKEAVLKGLSEKIDTSAPQYQQWVEL